MSSSIHIEKAHLDDAEAIAAVLQEAERWLASRGISLWSASEIGLERIQHDSGHGLYHVARDAGAVIGVMRLDFEDPSFWPEVVPGTSVYLHKLAVQRNCAEPGVATALLRYAVEYTRSAERAYLRLDCVSDRPGLRRRYEDFGFALHSLLRRGSRSYARYELSTGASPLLEFALEAPGPFGLLRGTALKPARWNGNVILMIPGSGPTDRDGNSPLGIRAATLRLLAEGLAEQGLASVRIDKRGLFGSVQAVPDPDAVTLQDYAQDVQRWTRVVRQRFGVTAIWLLGHSEGGLVALSTYPGDEAVLGLILLATPGRPLGPILREQLSRNPANAEILQDAFSAIAALEAGRRVDVQSFHPALQSLFRPSVQPFLADVMVLDPAARIGCFAKPILIVQGASDLQVSEGDARLLVQAARMPTLFIAPEANHVLKAVSPNDCTANFATYINPELPLTSGVVEAIGEFIRLHANAS